MNRKKLIHVVNCLDTGGMENGVINISNFIDRDMYEPVVCCRQGYGRMAGRLKSDVRVVDMKLADGVSLSSIRVMISFFVAEKPDIVHAHGWGCGSLETVIAATIARVPVIVNGEHGKFYARYYQVLLQRMLSYFCDITLSVSESLKQKVVNIIGIPANRIEVIRNGVDTSLFSGKHASGGIVNDLQTLGMGSLDPETFFVGCVGSIKPAKNQIALIRALELIHSQNTDTRVKILFIGDGPDRAKLEKYVSESPVAGKVLFAGERSDIPVVLSMCSMLALVSVAEHEGLPNVILEAMSSFLPVISTRSVGASEIVQHGVNGYLVDQDDIPAIARYIQHFDSDHIACKMMGKNARVTVEEKYSIQSMVSAYDELYSGLFSNKKGSV